MAERMWMQCGRDTVLTLVSRQIGARRIFDATSRTGECASDHGAKALVAGLFPSAAEVEETLPALVIPRHTVTVRNLHLPIKTSSEAESMIELQLSRVVPHKKEDIVYGYRISGRDKMGYARVIVAVVLKENIKALVAAMDQSGRLPYAAVLSSCETWKNVVATAGDLVPKDGLFAILDVGADAGDYIIASREHIHFTGTVSVTAAQLAHDAGIEMCVTQLAQAKTVFASEEFSAKPTRLFVTGIQSERLTERLKTGKEHGEVAELYDRTTVGFPDEKRYLLAKDSFTALLGAARRTQDDSLYFRVPEIETKRTITERSNELMLLGALLLAVVSLAVAATWGGQSQRARYLQRLSDQNRVIGNEIGEIARESDAASYVSGILQKRRDHVFALHTIDALFADTASTTYFSSDGDGGYTVRGQAKDSSQVFALVSRIEEHPACMQAEAKYARRKQTQQGDVTDFEIRFRLDPTAAEATQGGVR
jgi:type II secretory pathway pseudopilin PulG